MWWEDRKVRFRDFHPNVRTRIYVLFAFGTAQATTMPFMAIYFDEHFGEVLTGLLLTVSIVASVISGAIGGYYADRIGRKKLMVFSEGVFLLSYLVMAMANSPWFQSAVVTFITFLVTNICWGVYGPADEAMLMDVTTPETRQMMYSIFYWVGNLTMAVGASLGALFFENYRFILFSAMSVVVLGTLLTTIFRIEETLHKPVLMPSEGSLQTGGASIIRGMLRTYGKVLADKVFLRYIVAGMLAMTVETQLTNYIGIHLAKDVARQPLFQLSHWAMEIDGVKMLGFLQTENTVLVVLLATVVARWMARYRDKSVLFFGLVLNTLGYSFMIINSVPWLLIAAMFVATIGEVASVPTRQTYLADIAPVNARSSYIAVSGLTYNGSRVLASLGVMLGATAPSWVMALLSLTAGLVGFAFYQSIVSAVHQRRQSVQSLSV